MCLKLNFDKAEYILFGSTMQLKKYQQNSQCQWQSHTYKPHSEVFGVIYGQVTKLQRTCKTKFKEGNVKPCKIRSITRYISTEACVTLVLMLCITYPDYRNALLYGLPKKTKGK